MADFLAQADKFMATAYLNADYYLSYDLPLYSIPIYLVVIFGLKKFMENREPMDVQIPMALHNLFLFILSVAMATFTAFEVYRSGFGLNDLYCDATGKVLTGRLWFWCCVFYLSKYYELFDTVFIILRKKPLIFLHVWHHTSIAVLCLIFMKLKMNFFWSGVVWNSSIHTFMYWFYFNQSLGRDIWWKKYLTKAQIVQFVWGITSWWPYLKVCPSTQEVQYGWAINQFVLFSFLALFINFFFKRYQKKPAKKKSN
eukprot:TRINITY_DN4330_c2_g2_i2.p1 TRINITY_DN4330_c2_g2~~TRINITY_DN4330_c2_g2_i2.p1  ORF type:complete len:255 (+),score=74.84 TRINITY_DN4330_c2_g2_i2:66-830(+)